MRLTDNVELYLFMRLKYVTSTFSATPQHCKNSSHSHSIAFTENPFGQVTVRGSMTSTTLRTSRTDMPQNCAQCLLKSFSLFLLLSRTTAIQAPEGRVRHDGTTENRQ